MRNKGIDSTATVINVQLWTYVYTQGQLRPLDEHGKMPSCRSMDGWMECRPIRNRQVEETLDQVFTYLSLSFWVINSLMSWVREMWYQGSGKKKGVGKGGKGGGGGGGAIDRGEDCLCHGIVQGCLLLYLYCVFLAGINCPGRSLAPAAALAGLPLLRGNKAGALADQFIPCTHVIGW